MYTVCVEFPMLVYEPDGVMYHDCPVENDKLVELVDTNLQLYP
jgi:(2Fe-2S) ferredoxin